NLAGFIRDIIAKSIADCLAARSLVHDVTDSVMNFGHRVRAAKNEKEDTRPLTIDLTGKIPPHVFANQLLRGAVSGFCLCYNGVGIPFHQLSAGREYSHSH